MTYTGISGDDAAIFSMNSSRNDGTEDPVGRSMGSWIRNTMPPVASVKKIKSGAFPTGRVPNLTPGAKRLKW